MGGVSEEGKEVAGRKKHSGVRERCELRPRVSVFGSPVTALSAQTAGGKQ